MNEINQITSMLDVLQHISMVSCNPRIVGVFSFVSHTFLRVLGKHRTFLYKEEALQDAHVHQIESKAHPTTQDYSFFFKKKKKNYQTAITLLAHTRFWNYIEKMVIVTRYMYRTHS